MDDFKYFNIFTHRGGGGRRGGEEEEERGRGQKAEDKGGEEEKARLIPAKLISLITTEKTPAATF